MATWIRHDKNVLAWGGGLRIDVDGAPNAYGPGNTGLDWTANAGKEGDWYGVLTDRDGHPVLQGPDDPYPGDYIATTALQDHTKAVDDPSRYVDAVKIPYLSIPKNAVADYGAHVGDVGFAFCQVTGRMCAAVVADVGPRNKFGEGSPALARALGISDNARHGGAETGIVVVVFLGTARGWPRTNADVAQQVQDRLNELGGATYYRTLLTPPQS